jgi:MFS family permease
MDSIGRRGGLVSGLFLGLLGAGIAAWAVASSFMWGFLAALFMMGIANAAIVLGRFVAAEVHPPFERGRAISNVVVGGTVGAIVGPLLVAPSGEFVNRYGLDELTGPYLASLVLFFLAVLVIGFGLKPDPGALGKAIARLYPEPSLAQNESRSLPQIFRQPRVFIAVLTMVIGQMVMVMVMVITALHMSDHQHNLGQVSLVISAHTVGMFAFSIVSGQLADRWGRGPVILIGAATLLLSCLAAPLSPDVLPLAISLFLLGFGWNFCFVGGSTLLADQLSPAERARTQGFNDLLVGLASATASLSSGLIFAAVGFGTMAMIGAAFSIVPLAGGLLLGRNRLRHQEI